MDPINQSIVNNITEAPLPEADQMEGTVASAK